MNDKKFKLFQCCVPVKGAKNGLIIDFQRKTLHKVPNQIIDLIEEYSEKNIYGLFTDFRKSKAILKNYIRYFLSNELLIVSENTEDYPSLDRNFTKPYILDTIGCEIDASFDFFEFLIKNESNELGVNALKLILKNNEINNLIKINALLETSKIKNVVIYLEYCKEKLSSIKSLIIDNPRILQVVFYNCNTENESSLIEEKFCYEKQSLEKIFYNISIEHASDFVLDIDIYHEALHHNLMFNRTVFIDAFGNIRKHFSDPKSYGKIIKNSIKKVITNEEFSAFWNITKDEIEICKDCEFRYVCPDGRIPQRVDSEKSNYKSNTHCNYDPYHSTWN
ncbi:hypothetical protein Flavo103_24470 [Flavobacterium collinsii]|uniref:grasp-with-spasm system SPASM domain peptide maturase n=1 Tax=Flavobacterium collinsii TaxID=1114861 RepID=UPI0022BD3ECD|nr:grasp-with-spasm system SPASM domain peptide maturase [Flavobacterium collinsii]GIQ59311.1 hypothetical protein Flavo103_24470 [Flavobacterium collinsii]